jgi:hypothetical protein
VDCVQARRIGLVEARRCCGLHEGDSGGIVAVLLRDFAERREERGVFIEWGPAWARG